MSDSRVIKTIMDCVQPLEIVFLHSQPVAGIVPFFNQGYVFQIPKVCVLKQNTRIFVSSEDSWINYLQEFNTICYCITDVSTYSHVISGRQGKSRNIQ